MRTLLLAAFAVAALAAASPAAASAYCEDLWVSRNTIFHRAGFCFSSALGQQLFGNAGCRGTDPQLSAADRATADAIRAREQEAGCRVNTSRGPSPAMRQMQTAYAMLTDIPAPDEFGWGCLGYRGAPLTLRAGASEAAPPIGTASRGNYIYSQHLRRGNWTYYVVLDRGGGRQVAHGWTRQGIPPGSCEQEAG